MSKEIEKTNFYTLYDKNEKGFYEIYCKDNKPAFDKIAELLTKGEKVEVNNNYETFYGVEFDWRMKKAIEHIQCDIVVTSVNKWEGYPWTYEITPKK